MSVNDFSGAGIAAPRHILQQNIEACMLCNVAGRGHLPAGVLWGVSNSFQILNVFHVVYRAAETENGSGAGGQDNLQPEISCRNPTTLRVF